MRNKVKNYSNFSVALQDFRNFLTFAINDEDLMIFVKKKKFIYLFIYLFYYFMNYNYYNSYYIVNTTYIIIVIIIS
jgi:hypothetical protein